MIVLGFVSFFNDMASEMVTPFIPILIATVLGAGPVILGLVEGVAEAVASLLKLWAGRYSDGARGRRKLLTLTGYGIANLVRPLMGLAGSWATVLVLRGLDRVGKGVRSAPRDALLAEEVHPDIHGRAYGFQRMLDNAGAMLGTLLAIVALAWGGMSVQQVIAWSALPGVLVMMLLVWGVQEPVARPVAPVAVARLSWAALPPAMRQYLGVLVLFTFARASEGFILLRANELGMTLVQVLLVWALLNLCKSLTSSLGGRLADRYGRQAITRLGWLGYGMSYLAFSQVGQADTLWLGALVYGLVVGFSEGSERALISVRVAEAQRGTAFGWYHLAVGLSAIPAGLLFGAVWHYASAGAAFMLAGVLALASALLLRRD